MLIVLLLFYSCHNVTNNFSEDEILYKSKCSSCHNLIESTRFDKETWHLYVDRYGQEMNTEEKELLLDYLTGSE